MRPPSLRSQLNQIRLWLRQGRTDAWIAHKLDISVGELEQFKRDHRLSGEPPPPPEMELEPVEPEVSTEPEVRAEAEAPEETAVEEPSEPEGGEAAEDEQPRRRRRGRRGGRRRGGSRTSSYEATFDHGEEGYGLWLDPSVVDDPVYTEHWAGHRPVSVTVDADTITIRRSSGDEAS